jgi:hypothetical protein
MEDLYYTLDCRAKHNYLDTIPNPKGIKVGIQYRECML